MYVVKCTVILLCLTIAGCQRIVIKDGRMTISGKENCTVNVNGIDIRMGPGVQVGMYYGLITYKCGVDYGYIISKISCKECGMYCVYNDSIEGCQNSGLQYAIGICIGMVVGVILSIIIYKTFGSAITNIYYYIVAFIQSMHDNKSNKNAKIISEHINEQITPIYKDKYNIIKHKKKAYKNRKSDKDDQISLSESEEYVAEYKDMSTSESEGCSTKPNARHVYFSKRGLNPNIALTTIITLCIVSLCNGCDMNFYIRSEGKICDSIKCNDVNFYSFPLQYGQSVCFQTFTGEMIKFRMINANEKKRYSYLYATSDAKIGIDYHWRCEGTEECDKAKCRHGVKHPLFKTQHDLDFYNCVTEASPCDNYCYWSTQCIYYNYWITPTGDVYKVYGLMSKIWELDIEIESNDVKTRKTINVNNPTVTFSKVIDNKPTTLPLHISGVNYEELPSERTVVLIDKKVIAVSSSDLNMPVSGMVGDLQLQPDNYDKITIDPNMIKCQVDNCHPVCLLRQPGIMRVMNRTDRYRQYDVVKSISNEHIIEIKSKIRPNVMVSTGNINLLSMYVSNAKCDIMVSMTYACTSCVDGPMVIIEAENIKTEGTLVFESNCTFKQPYLSCSDEPYIIEPVENYGACHIYIPSTNQSIHFKIDYVYKGELSPIRMINYKEGTVETVKSIITSKPFYESMANTVGTCAVVSTIITCTVKLVRAYAITKIKSDVNNA